MGKEKNVDKKNNIKKILIALIIAVLIIIIVILGVIIGKNNKILKEIQGNIEKYENSQNYTLVEKNKNNDMYQETEIKCKDGMTRTNIAIVENGAVTKQITKFSNANEVDSYFKVNEKKTAVLSKNGAEYQNPIINYTESDNLFRNLINALTLNVTKGTVEGKECYILKNFKCSNYLYDASEQKSDVYAYIEVKTGLLVKVSNDLVTDENNSNQENNFTKYSYEFANVIDEDMQQPDVSEYEVVNNE